MGLEKSSQLGVLQVESERDIPEVGHQAAVFCHLEC